MDDDSRSEPDSDHMSVPEPDSSSGSDRESDERVGGSRARDAAQTSDGDGGGDAVADTDGDAVDSDHPATAVTAHSSEVDGETDTDTDTDTDTGTGVKDTTAEGDEGESLEALRQQVEKKYDFDEFGPEDMDRMSVEEWEVSFDPETWVTGSDLLERVEAELKTRISRREVFAVFERLGDGRILAYSDEGYVIVQPDGSIEGQGTVLEDVKPTVALCSMPEYEPPSPPENYELPDPQEVPEGTGEFGNWMIQAMAFTQLTAGVVLMGAWLLSSNLTTLIAPAMALFFLGAAVFLFATVANARLSDRFRSEEYRGRLRSVHVEEPPDFVPVEIRDPGESSPAGSIPNAPSNRDES